MTKVKEVRAWQADDGSLHLSESEANSRNMLVEFDEVCKNDRIQATHVGRFADIEDLKEWLKRNSSAVCGFLVASACKRGVAGDLE